MASEVVRTLQQAETRAAMRQTVREANDAIAARFRAAAAQVPAIVASHCPGDLVTPEAAAAIKADLDALVDRLYAPSPRADSAVLRIIQQARANGEGRIDATLDREIKRQLPHPSDQAIVHALAGR